MAGRAVTGLIKNIDPADWQDDTAAKMPCHRPGDHVAPHT